MDNIDSSKGLNDFLPIQDWFNEMHAKIRAKKLEQFLKIKANLEFHLLIMCLMVIKKMKMIKQNG